MTEISIDGDAVVESSNNNLRFTVRLSETSVNDVVVRYRTLLNGTASDEDLRFGSTISTNNGSLTIPAGQTSASILVRTNGDSVNEFDEAITLELFDPVSATLAGGAPALRATGIIRDDDGGPDLAVFTSAPVIVEGDTGQKLAVFDVSLSRVATGPITLSYATADGTAVAGEDYAARSGQLTLAPGQTTFQVEVPVFGDALAEGAETFALIVTPPAGRGIGTQGAVGEALILDTDAGPSPEISIDGAAAVESSSNNLRFVVRLSEPSGGNVVVNYRTLLNGTASDEDLRFGSTISTNNGSVTIPLGETSASIFVRVNGDGTNEFDEAITLELFDPLNATLAGGESTLRATGIILDDDGAPDLAVLTSDLVLTEGDGGQKLAVFDVSLSRAATGPVTLDYATADGTAVAGEDYVARSGQLTFAPGQTTLPVAVPVLGDGRAEGAEAFNLVVTSPANRSIDVLGAVGEALILDADAGPSPEISIDGAAAVESSSNNLRFVVRLSEPSGGNVVVNYRTLLSGTASDADLRFGSTSSSNNGSVTIAAGQTSASIFVRVNGDGTNEFDEAITLELFDPINATLAGGGATLRAAGFILDDDGAGDQGAGFDTFAFAVDQVVRERASALVIEQVAVELSRPSANALAFDVAAIDGTAKAGRDFALLADTVTFAPGQTLAAVPVRILGDAVEEGSERFSLSSRGRRTRASSRPSRTPG